MRAVLVVVANILREQSLQMAFADCNDLVQEVTTATFDPTLRDAVLPRTLEGGSDRGDRQRSNGCRNLQSILAVTVEDEKRGADSNGNASRNCWTTHRLVGCLVTLRCRMRRRP